MPEIFDLVFRWWKQIVSLVTITLVATTIIVFLIPKKYLAVATALPASSYSADKTGVFSQIMEKLQQIHQDVQITNNALMLSKIRDEYAEKKVEYQKLSDSLQHTTNSSVTDLLNIQKSSMLQQMLEYEKLLDQYTLMVNAKLQALIINERATPPLKPDKPKTIAVITGATVLSLFFGLLAALVLERRKATK